MKIYLRILSFVMPYKWVIFLSIMSSLLFVFFNAFSLWLVSSLIYMIMIPENKVENQVSENSGLYSKLDEFANFLRNYPNSKILYIIRDPIQMVESWILHHFEKLQIENVAL